jgi:hypothetical protein
MIDPGTGDAVPEEGGFGFLGRLIGLDRLERHILDRLDQLEARITSPQDTAALEAALIKLKAADVTVDNIEKGEPT